MTRRRALLIPVAALALWILFAQIGPRLRPDHNPPRVTKLSGARKALDMWGAQRAYPGDRVPEAAFGLAWDQTRSMRLTRNSIDDSVDPWDNLGPANIGGRTLCIALHPDDPEIIFAGSASGGLWKTTTGGMGADAWDYVPTGFPVLGVSTIDIDEDNPDLIYIGTGEVYSYQGSTGGDVDRLTRGSYGIGILKSTDGGATWAMCLDWTYAQTRGVWMIRIHPDDPQTVFAATTEGVYRTTNGGGDWTLIHDVIMAVDLRLHPTDPETIFVGCGNFGSAGHGVYRSLDGGDNWTQLTAGLPGSWTGKPQLAISTLAPYAIYASIANWDYGHGLYRSLDGGDTWSQLSNINYASYQGWYSHYVLPSPFDTDDLFTGGIEIWRSTNGGASLSQRSQWTQIYYGTPPPEGPNGGPQYAHADHHFAVWHPTDPETVFFASDGGVFRTTDGGDTFRCLIGGYVTTQFYNGFANSGTDPQIAIGGMQDNLSAIYQGTVAWNRVIGGDGSWAAIDQQDDSNMFGSWQNLNIRRSTNGGANWSSATPPTQAGDQTAFIAPYVLSPSNPSILYAGRSRVYRSANQGSSWTATNGGLPLDGSNPMMAMAMAADDPGTVYAASAAYFSRARVFRTTNDGGSWDDVTGTLPDRYISDLAVDPTDPTRIFATLMGFGSSHLFKSIDAGATWIDIGDGLPDIPASAVEIDPHYPEVVYVGTDLGVFISPDSGANWYTFDTGMQTTQINDLKVFGPQRRIRAATHGGGVFDRPLFDPTTSSVAELLPAIDDIPTLQIFPNPLTATSQINFELGRGARVELSLYDVRGRRLRSLASGYRDAGTHSLPFSGKDLSAGVYFVRLKTGDMVRSTRVITTR